jgi:hypothetical protein
MLKLSKHFKIYFLIEIKNLLYICFPKIKAVFTAKILKIFQNLTNPDSKKEKTHEKHPPHSNN